MTTRSPNGNWTFLSNHGHVLVLLGKKPESLIREIADEVGITERAVQGIIADLENEGYISVERVGRRNLYRVNRKSKFRHPAEAHRSIDSLLKIFT